MMLFIISKLQKNIKPTVKLALLARYILVNVKIKTPSNPRFIPLISALIVPIQTSILTISYCNCEASIYLLIYISSISNQNLGSTSLIFEFYIILCIHVCFQIICNKIQKTIFSPSFVIKLFFSKTCI